MEELIGAESVTRTKPNAKKSNVALVVAGVAGGLGLALTVASVPFLTPAFRRFALPYLPATPEQLLNVKVALKMCDKSKPLVDLGSGDGRIVIEAAKEGFQASGVELNYWLVLYSRLNAFKTLGNASSLASFRRQDIWKVDMRPYGTAVIFGVDTMMAPLGNKFAKEMHSSANVVACRFPIPGWTPSAVIGEGIDTVWLYRLSDNGFVPR